MAGQVPEPKKMLIFGARNGQHDRHGKEELQHPDIAFYNNERPHMSIGYQTPSEAHKQSGEQKQCWKNPWERPKEKAKSPIFDPPNEKPLWIVLR